MMQNSYFGPTGSDLSLLMPGINPFASGVGIPDAFPETVLAGGGGAGLEQPATQRTINNKLKNAYFICVLLTNHGKVLPYLREDLGNKNFVSTSDTSAGCAFQQCRKTVSFHIIIGEEVDG